jgi:hypothetical protein
MKIKALALDLEGTLISNAVSQFPRPGLRSFLEFCFHRFDRVLLFTAVPKDRANHVISTLVAEGHAPPEMQSRLEYVHWDRRYKDLRFIAGAKPKELLLVEDQEHYIVPEQRKQWIPVREYEPPYEPEDSELVRVRAVIESRLSNE